MRVLLSPYRSRGRRTARGTRGAVAGAEVQVARPLHGQIGFSWSTPNTSVRGELPALGAVQAPDKPETCSRRCTDGIICLAC
jgi:hypothetical protein